MARYTHAITSVTCTGPHPAPILNPTMAQRMICASICAYDIKPRGFSPACQYWDLIMSNGQVSIVSADPGFLNPAIDAGFVTVTNDGWVVLSLRGTLPSYNSFDTFIAYLKDWWQDSESRHVPFFLGGTFMGNVHNGFHKTFLAMRPKIQSALDAINWSQVKGLQVTGHSKGAGVSFLFAAWAHSQYKAKGLQTIEVNAFAAPLTGDAYFASAYKGLGIKSTRHQRAHDIVPFLAPYDSYDIFDHFSFLDSWTAAVLEIISLDIYTGYHLTGDLIYYPGTVPGKVSPEAGSKAATEAQKAIITAIKNDQSSEIENAHSAVKSYYPALVP